jgi:hypothetical protein
MYGMGILRSKRITWTMLRNDQWSRIKDHFPDKAADGGVTAADNRLFVEAVLWIWANPGAV